MKRKLGILLGVGAVVAVLLYACVDSGPGSDFVERVLPAGGEFGRCRRG